MSAVAVPAVDALDDARHASSRANEHKVHQRWREVMRARRRRATREEIESAAKAHDDALDDRERALANLDAAMDESERTHRVEAEAQARRLEEASTRADAETATIDARTTERLRALRETFESEDAHADERWREDVHEALERAEAGRAAFEREQDARRASFEDKREEIRNQHGEDVSTMKIMYENKIKELEGELARVTAPSVTKGELGCADSHWDADEELDHERAYELIRARDDADAKRLAKTKREIQKLQSKVDHWREKTQSRTSEWNASHARRVAERDQLLRRYDDVKSGVTAMRDARASALRKMCVSSENAIKELTKTLEHARRVLRVESLNADLRRRHGVDVEASTHSPRRSSRDAASDAIADYHFSDAPMDYAQSVLERFYARRTAQSSPRAP